MGGTEGRKEEDKGRERRKVTNLGNGGEGEGVREGTKGGRREEGQNEPRKEPWDPSKTQISVMQVPKIREQQEVHKGISVPRVQRMRDGPLYETERKEGKDGRNEGREGGQEGKEEGKEESKGRKIRKGEGR
eukprot:jgi/Botrbrau1/9773/Bobra.85_1s0018.1